MPAPDKPQLRQTITGHPDADDANFVWLYDAAPIGRQMLRVRRELIPILELFTGENSLREMQIALVRAAGGRLVPIEMLTGLAEKLDEGLFLEGPRLLEHYGAFLRSPVREPACIGSYEEKPEALRRQLRDLFLHDKGPGALPNPGGKNGTTCGAEGRPAATLRGMLIPHIDFTRGGPTFAWGFKELVEHTDATVFVIIGTAHYSSQRFTLTRKDFRTPLGVAQTDRAYVDRIAATYGQNAFLDEVAHLPEHAIEFQVLMLQYCLGERPFRIVPLLVGSFHDCIVKESPPHEQADVYLMIQALRRAEAESGEKVCYISSADLAHIGPKFGDPQHVSRNQLAESKRQDEALLRHAEAGNRAGFFEVVLAEQDRRRICGFPPTYTLLSVLEPQCGKLLHYDQYIEPRGFESVSFASLAFYK